MVVYYVTWLTFVLVLDYRSCFLSYNSINNIHDSTDDFERPVREHDDIKINIMPRGWAVHGDWDRSCRSWLSYELTTPRDDIGIRIVDEHRSFAQTAIGMDPTPIADSCKANTDSKHSCGVNITAQTTGS